MNIVTFFCFYFALRWVFIIFAPKKMRIAVFCSANDTIDADFFTMTRELGEWMGHNGHTLVYGGHDTGLMECVAQAVSTAGGQVIGVIPTVLDHHGHTSRYVDVRILCETLSERKDIMLDHCDVVVALPGGLGTLDEVFSVAAASTLGYHDKRVIAFNMKGFWNPLEALLDDLQQRGFIRGDYHRHIAFATDLDELCRLLNASRP